MNCGHFEWELIAVFRSFSMISTSKHSINITVFDLVFLRFVEGFLLLTSAT